MLISRTPYRLSFYGGGLDYPGWYQNNQAKVLCGGLDYYCYLTVRELPPFFKHKYRACYSKVEITKTIDEINNIELRCKKNPQISKIVFFNFFSEVCKKASNFS